MFGGVTIALFALFAIGVALWLFVRYRRARRRALFARSLPRDWVDILNRNVRLYRLLPEKLRRELHGHINIFLHEKRFEGCAGLELGDEIRLTVAAQACMLLLGRKTRYYPRLSTILVYPGAYLAKHVTRDGFIELVDHQPRLGESWHRGPVVLSWEQVRQDALDLADGHNVVLHEFAHQLDQEDDAMDGAPILQHRGHYSSWSRVLSREFAALRQKADQGVVTLLDQYGATEPAEFFAVLTEIYFEKPRQLKARHPDLYEELQMFYRVEPLEWSER